MNFTHAPIIVYQQNISNTEPYSDETTEASLGNIIKVSLKDFGATTKWKRYVKPTKLYECEKL